MQQNGLRFLSGRGKERGAVRGGTERGRGMEEGWRRAEKGEEED